MSEQERDVFIYALQDPRDGAIRYIGRTCDVVQRLRRHLQCHKDTPVCRWIHELQSEGLTPKAVSLERCTMLLCDEREAFWEEAFRNAKQSLLNVSVNGGPKYLSIEARQHIGDRPVSDQTRARLSEAGKKRKQSPETRAKIGAAHRGKVVSEEARQHMSDGQKRRQPPTEESRRKMSESRKGKRGTASRFTDDDVRKIRWLYSTGLTTGQIGRVYGAGYKLIWAIVNGKTYTHVPEGV